MVKCRRVQPNSSAVVPVLLALPVDLDRATSPAVTVTTSRACRTARRLKVRRELEATNLKRDETKRLHHQRCQTDWHQGTGFTPHGNNILWNSLKQEKHVKSAGIRAHWWRRKRLNQLVASNTCLDYKRSFNDGTLKHWWHMSHQHVHKFRKKDVSWAQDTYVFMLLNSWVIQLKGRGVKGVK